MFFFLIMKFNSILINFGSGMVNCKNYIGHDAITKKEVKYHHILPFLEGQNIKVKH